MTISIGIKVADCIVLGADSAVSIPSGDGSGIANVYFNAEKIINLYKGLPIGVVTWGLGTLSGRSITALAKDLRNLLMKEKGWKINRTTYTLKEITERLTRFMYEDRYQKQYPQKRTDPSSGVQVDVFDSLGFLVAGYSAGQAEGELWKLQIDSQGNCSMSEELGKGQFGVRAEGQPEAATRLMLGFSPSILNGLVASGIKRDEAEQFLLKNGGGLQLIHPAMPIQDTIDLVRYLIEVTAGYVRFVPGAPTVHPPIDLAVISHHEHFRWVQRKHYYNPELNPPF